MRKPIAAFASAVLLAILATLPAVADSLSIDFESYSLGTVHLQDGWSSSGAAGSGCAVYDHAIANPAAFGVTSLGSRSLRISNAVTSGCFGDQTFSKSLADEAGETSAEDDGVSGPRRRHFEAAWDFVSAVPTAEQPGLSVVASPDRGDGARMSWVQMADTPGGLEVNFYDYRDLAPFGNAVGDTAGCGDEDLFEFSPIATGLDRSQTHQIKVTMDFVDGPRNDVVNVYVDGVLLHTGTSWEDYFRYCEGNPTRTVDSILFRTGGDAAPALAGKGFLIDNITYSSANTPQTKADCKKGGWMDLTRADGSAFKNQGQCIKYVNNGAPGADD